MTAENARRQTHVGVVIHETGKTRARVIAREIGLGLEEEQMPYTLITSEDKPADAVAAAFRASVASVFGVGIGISPDIVVLHYSRLPEDKPLTVVPANPCDHKKFRTLGLNAARLVKGKILEKI